VKTISANRQLLVCRSGSACTFALPYFVPCEIALVHDDIVIGSGTGCDVILQHPSFVPRHARVQWRKQGYILIDLQSPTGTSVNGRRITENLLKDGWKIRLGEVEYVFQDAREKNKDQKINRSRRSSVSHEEVHI
jgi:pSer/pThr/pTyr-binding forkhead associated (FHA) protein